MVVDMDLVVRISCYQTIMYQIKSWLHTDFARLYKSDGCLWDNLSDLALVERIRRIGIYVH